MTAFATWHAAGLAAAPIGSALIHDDVIRFGDDR